MVFDVKNWIKCILQVYTMRDSSVEVRPRNRNKLATPKTNVRIFYHYDKRRKKIFAIFTSIPADYPSFVDNK